MLNDSKNDNSNRIVNSFELLSGYISNELNSGKSKEKILKKLVEEMNIDEKIASKLVYDNENFRDRMYYFSTSYIRKNISKYCFISLIVATLIFLIITNLEKEIIFYGVLTKYLLIPFFFSLFIFAFLSKESENFTYNFIGLISTITTSISSFLIGIFLLLYISWDNIEKINSSGLKFRFIISFVNFIVELGPNIVGSIFLIISLVFIFISWNFYYKITIINLNK
jgi:hypothetical protein